MIYVTNHAIPAHLRGNGYWTDMVDDLLTFALIHQDADAVEFELWAGDGAAEHIINARGLERAGDPVEGPKTGRMVQPVRVTREQLVLSGRVRDLVVEGL